VFVVYQRIVPSEAARLWARLIFASDRDGRAVNILTTGIHVLDERVDCDRQHGARADAAHVIQIDDVSHDPRTAVQNLVGEPRAVCRQYDPMCLQRTRYRVVVDARRQLDGDVGALVLVVPADEVTAVMVSRTSVR
jgi:hypothetical protein